MNPFQSVALPDKDLHTPILLILMTAIITIHIHDCIQGWSLRVGDGNRGLLPKIAQLGSSEARSPERELQGNTSPNLILCCLLIFWQTCWCESGVPC